MFLSLPENITTFSSVLSLGPVSQQTRTTLQRLRETVLKPDYLTNALRTNPLPDFVTPTVESKLGDE